MALLDWIVIGVFCFALIGIVVWVVSQKNDNSADYFLGGKDATWIAIGASIFASNIGSEHLIGLAGAGASSGMAMAHWEIQGWMILILGWVFVPFYTRSLRADQGCRYGLCRWPRVPAGIWYQGTLGH